MTKPGTFRLSGTITDAITRGPLDRVRVKMVMSTGWQAATESGRGLVFPDAPGGYALYDAVGPLQLTISAEGYETQTRDFVVTGDLTADIALKPLAAADVSGNWKFSVSASQSCRGNLPADAGDRQYDVTVAQETGHLTLRLTHPQIVNGVGGMKTGAYVVSGLIVGDALSFRLEQTDTDYDWAIPDLIEQLDTFRWVGVNGNATGTLSHGEVAGTMFGAFEYWTTPLPANEQPNAGCLAIDHSWTLVRR